MIDSAPQLGGNSLALAWTDFKGIVLANNTPMFFGLAPSMNAAITNGGTYTILAQVGPTVITCQLVQTGGSVLTRLWPNGYSQAQNDIDVADWETNFKNIANQQAVAPTMPVAKQLSTPVTLVDQYGVVQNVDFKALLTGQQKITELLELIVELLGR